MARFREIEFHDQFDIIVAIANGGIIPAAILNQRLGVEFQILKINLRDTNQKPKYENPQLLSPVGFEYRDKTILMVEDRIKTGATINFAIHFLRILSEANTFHFCATLNYH